MVIPAFNCAKTIRRAVDSILGQGLPVEVIVVDDGSTDETLAVLASYGERVSLLWQANQGAGAARNRGIREAHGQYIAFLDADDEWYHHKLHRQLQLFERYPHVRLVSAAARYVTESGTTVQMGTTNLRGNVLETLLYTNYIVTSSVVVRRDCLENLDPLFRTEFAPAEDWELWLRLSARYDLIVSPDVLVRYTVTKGSVSRRHTPEYLRTLYLSIYSSLLQDPCLKSAVERHWKDLQANVHFKVACQYYEAGQVWQARKEVLYCAIMSPLRIKWPSALGMLLLPLPAWRGIKRFMAIACERTSLECLNE